MDIYKDINTSIFHSTRVLVVDHDIDAISQDHCHYLDIVSEEDKSRQRTVDRQGDKGIDGFHTQCSSQYLYEKFTFRLSV